MSDSDSDDFFYNQNLTDEENDVRAEPETVVDTSNLHFESHLIAKRPFKDDWENPQEEGRRKIMKVNVKSAQNYHDSNSSDEAVNSSDDDCISVSSKNSMDEIHAPTAMSVKEDTEEDQTLNFLTEVVGKAQKFTKERSPELAVKRIYNISFVSKLDGSKDKRVNVKVTGRKTFETILPLTMQTFVSSYKVNKSLASLYKPSDLVMYRNGVEVLPFSTCDSLRIPETPDQDVTPVELIILHSSMAMQYRSEFKKIRDSRLQSLEAESLISEHEASAVASDDMEEINFNKFEKELEHAPKLHTNLVDLVEVLDDNEIDLNPIKVVLVDKTNKKTTISVKNSTTFNQIINDYKEILNIVPEQKVVLILDNSELDPFATIESEDIEDNDILEVRIL